MSTFSVIVLILVSFSTFKFIKQGGAAKTNDKSESSGSSAVTTDTEGDHLGQRSAQEYSPFMVLFDEEDPSIRLPENYILPSKYTYMEQKLSLAADKSDLQEIPLCPELKTKNKILKNALRSLNRTVPDTKGCLFVAEFLENERQVCEKEPRPWLAVEQDLEGNELICGTNKEHQLISAEYYNCGTKKHFKEYYEILSVTSGTGGTEPKLQPQVYDMYEICYDFKNKKTLWTKHYVRTPELLTHKDYPHKNLDTINLDQFETETFRLALSYSTFTAMKYEYESVDTIMKIHPLVPKDHMALPYWKKSTDHMINSAPLLPEFRTLMKAIHNGILLASNYFRREFHQKLTIYTKAETIYSLEHTAATIFYLKPVMKYFMPEISTDIFRPSMWYMIVYDENVKSAVLIVLHNTREDRPVKKECDDNEMLPCDFKSWAENPNSIPESELQNAYCCSITQEKVETLFLISNLEIEKNLDIQEIINLARGEPSKTIIDEQARAP